ncbi:hypothetical protein ACTXT7_002260 [Hymenolepis weldensis]
MPIPNLPSLLIVGCYDGIIHIFRLDGTNFPCLHTLKDHTDIVTGFALSASSSKPQTPDGRCLFASSSADCTVRLWNALTGECLSVFREHNDGVFTLTFCDQWIVSVDFLGFIHTRNLDGSLQRKKRRWKIHVDKIRYDGRWLIARGRRRIRIYDTDNPQDVQEIKFNGCTTNMVDFISGEIIYWIAKGVFMYNFKTKEKVRFQKDGSGPKPRVVVIQACDMFNWFLAISTSRNPPKISYV